MSYMKTIAYTHSSDSRTSLYGFACVFLLGLIWAAARRRGHRHCGVFHPRGTDQIFRPHQRRFSVLVRARRGRAYTRDWPRYQYFLGGETGVINLTILVVIAVCLIRRQYWGLGSRLMLYMAGGWWAGTSS